MSNIELLKKNGELITKYHNRLTNEVRRLIDGFVDDETINRCNSEMLSILNEFTSEIVDYNKEGLELITDKNYIIHLVDKKNPDNESYITYWNFDDSNNYEYNYEDSLSRKNAFKFTYEEANRIVLKLKEKIGKDYDIYIEFFETLTTDEILEKVYSSKERKLYKLHTNQITYLIRPEEFERLVSGKATEILINLFDDTDCFIGTQIFSATVDTWSPYVVIDEKRYRPDDFSLVSRDKVLKKNFSPAKKAYETIMNTKSKRKDRR